MPNTANVMDLHAYSGFNFKLGGNYSGNIATPMTINNLGNVGIGTANPGGKLEVSNGSNNGVVIGAPNLSIATLNNQTAGIAFRRSNDGALAGGMRLYDDSGGAASLAVKARTDITFLNNSTQTLTIKESGKIGIGTTSPAALLHLNDAGGASINDPTYSGSLNYQMVLGSNVTSADGVNAILLGSGSYGNNPIIRFKTSSGDKGYIGWTGGAAYYFVGTHNTKDLRLRTDSADRLTVKGDGTVGIGTTSPQSRLDVAGGARVGADAVCSAAKAGMLAWNSNKLQVCTDAGTFTDIASSSGGSSQWVDGTGGAIYYNGGNVGIGTASPGSTLQVAGELRVADGNAATSHGLRFSGSSLGLTRETAGGEGLRIGPYNNSWAKLYSSGWRLNGSQSTYSWSPGTPDGVADTALSRIASGSVAVGTGGLGAYNGTLVAGNVGIGTANPAYLLDVNGSVRIAGSTATYDTLFNYSTNRDIYLRAGAAAGKIVIGDQNTGNVELGSVGSVAVVNGTLGVGTASPAATALVDLTSTSKGFLPPRMTATQRDAIASPAEGLTVFNTTTAGLETYGSGVWQTGAPLRAIGRGTGGDYNTMIQNVPGGILWMDGPGSVNGPAGTTTGTLLHLDPLWNDSAAKNKYAIQLATNGNTGNTLYFRAQYGGSWSSWAALGGGGASGTPGGANTNVQFNNSGAFGGDSNFVWDNANKRLGIGGMAPLSAFHVGSNGSGGRNMQVGTDGRMTIRYDDNSNISSIFLENRGITAVGHGSNINFGMAAAGAAANTAARISAIAEALFDSATNNDASLAFSTVRDNVLGERMRIDSSGNVGIGTTTPAWKLHISDSIAPVIQLAEGDTAGNAFIGVDANNLFFRRGTIGTADAMTITSASNVGIGTFTPAGKLHVAADNSGFSPQLIVGGATNPNNRLYLGYSTTADLGLIQSITEGIAFRNLALNAAGGNVGIGTTSPGEKLHVAGIVLAGESASTNGSLALAGAYQTGDYLLTLGSLRSSGGTMLGFGVKPSSTTAMGYVSSTAIPTGRSAVELDGSSVRIMTAASQTTVVGSPVSMAPAVTVLNSGNVGIGTTAPSEKLHLNSGRILVTGTSYTLNPAGAVFGQYDATTGYAQAPANGKFQIWDDATAAIATFADSGNVGIGTTSPSTRLHVVGENPVRIQLSGGSTLLYGGNTSGQDRFALNLDNDVPTFYDAYDGNWNPSIRLVNGKVGIGTADPSGYRLEVRGGPSYAIMGQPTSASHGGLLGYSQNGNVYGILGYANTYSFHGNASAYVSTSMNSHAAFIGYHSGANYGGSFTSTGSHALFAQSLGNNGYAGYFNANSGSGSIAVYGRQDWTNGHAGLFHNASWNVYCYLGHGSNYAIICSGPTAGLSDRRLKAGIVPLREDEGLKALMAIKPVHYHWKAAAGDRKGERPEMGFIAQEVEKVLPELVGETTISKEVRKEGQPEKVKTLSYERMAAPIVKAIQELKALFDGHDGRMIELEAANDNLSTRLIKLEQTHARTTADLEARIETLTRRLEAIEEAR